MDVSALKSVVPFANCVPLAYIENPSPSQASASFAVLKIEAELVCSSFAEPSFKRPLQVAPLEPNPIYPPDACLNSKKADEVPPPPLVLNSPKIVNPTDESIDEVKVVSGLSLDLVTAEPNVGM